MEGIRSSPRPSAPRSPRPKQAAKRGIHACARASPPTPARRSHGLHRRSAPEFRRVEKCEMRSTPLRPSKNAPKKPHSPMPLGLTAHAGNHYALLHKDGLAECAVNQVKCGQGSAGNRLDGTCYTSPELSGKLHEMSLRCHLFVVLVLVSFQTPAQNSRISPTLQKDR